MCVYQKAKVAYELCLCLWGMVKGISFCTSYLVNQLFMHSLLLVLCNPNLLLYLHFCISLFGGEKIEGGREGGREGEREGGRPCYKSG